MLDVEALRQELLVLEELCDLEAHVVAHEPQDDEGPNIEKSVYDQPSFNHEELLGKLNELEQRCKDITGN